MSTLPLARLLHPVLAAGLLFCGFPFPEGKAAVFLSDARLATLRGRVEQKIEPTYAAYLSLRRDADTALQRVPQPPTTWYVPGYYKDPVGHQNAKNGLAADANSAYGLALMYRLTDDRRYAAAAVRLLDGWATGVKTLSRQDDSRLSFSYHFPAMIFAAALLDGFPGWPPPARQAFKDFVRDKALPMNTMERENNWGNWGLVLVIASAAYLQDHALFERAVERWKDLTGKQIAADGHLPLEVIRNNGVGERGLWYSNFSLMPQTIAAEIARVNGCDLYAFRSPEGRTLRQAYECLVPWVAAPTTFPYYKGADPQGQRETDYVSYWEILNARWPLPAASAVLATRRPLTAMHSAPYLTLTHGDLLND